MALLIPHLIIIERFIESLRTGRVGVRRRAFFWTDPAAARARRLLAEEVESEKIEYQFHQFLLRFSLLAKRG
jgi:hypothetical protein